MTWIEQVVTKAHDLEGGPPAVLVSSVGFSEAAREKTRSYGHDERLVTDVTLEEFRSWLQMEHMVLVVCERGLTGCDIELAGEEEPPSRRTVSEALAVQGSRAPILRHEEIGQVSVGHISERWFGEKQEQVGATSLPTVGRSDVRSRSRSRNPRDASRSRPTSDRARSPASCSTSR